ncbi:MAG: heme biosynthesis protein HemY, partial [Beijerinckiaceae bacterium]
NEDARTLGLRGLFIEAQRRGDPDEALSFARQAQQAQPALSWANDALLEWHCQQQDWSQALALLQRMQKQLDKPLYRRQRAVLLTAYATSLHRTDSETALDLAQEAVKLAPDLVPATLLMAQLLVAREDLRKASRLLESCWALAPHPDLAHAYIHLRHGDSPVDRLTRAEVLTRQNADLPDSRYALAGCAINARDFTRARQLMAPVIANRPTTRFCLLMARLEQLEHHDPSAAQIWLARASRAPRNAAWIADGLVSDHWAAVSPVTGRLDAFRWMYPQESITTTDQPDIDAPMPAPVTLAAAPMAAPIAAKTAPENKKPLPKVASSVVFPLVTSPDDPGPMDASGDDEASQTGKPAKPVHLFGG